jgi:transposase
MAKERYFNTETFYKWIIKNHLPHCNPFPGPRNVIILDNASSHCDPIIAEAIHAKGCLVRYLPPYSPDFSPIELSFSVLKAWVRRRFHELWPAFEGSFGEFLIMCVAKNRCDRFAVTHFRHSGSEGYIFSGDIERFEQELREFERESGDDDFEI